MPAPLPKPATPPVKPDATGQNRTPVPPMTSVAPGAPTPTRPTLPTSSPIQAARPPMPTAPGLPQTATPAMQSSTPRPATPAVQSAPPTGSINPTVPPPISAMPPSPAPAASIPGQPPIQAARPPMPTAPGLPQQPVRIQQPPQTLTALSSMASNRLPSGAGATTQNSGSAMPGKLAPAPTMTSTPQGPKNPQDPQFVQPKKSFIRFLPFIGGGILLILILGFVAFRFLGLGGGTTNSVVNDPSTGGSQTGSTTGTNGTGSTGTTAPATGGAKVTLEYWGLWEPSEVMASVVLDYETKNPNVSIKYSKQSHQDYRVRLQNALNSENGPDIFRYHASWVPMFRTQLAALPTSVMTPNDFQSTFYPVAVNQLQSNGQLVGIPLMYDGLVLFYNTELLKTAVVEPPKTWSELRTTASQLTLKQGNTITRGGVALGNATNVEHFSDVIAVLILQNGGDLSKPNSPEVRDALLFYSNFIKTDNVWSETLPSSTVAFARGDVAMMMAPSWRAHEVAAMNPELKFATSPLPQLSTDTRTTWASYWAEGVNTKSSKKDESWKFLKYLSSKEVQQKMFSDQSKVRGFGELYSRKDLANELATNEVASSIMQDAPFAKGWQMSSYTHDDGVNDQIIQYYEDAVTSLLEGKQIEEVQTTLNQGVSQVLRQYGITTTE